MCWGKGEGAARALCREAASKLEKTEGLLGTLWGVGSAGRPGWGWERSCWAGVSDGRRHGGASMAGVGTWASRGAHGRREDAGADSEHWEDVGDGGRGVSSELSSGRVFLVTALRADCRERVGAREALGINQKP